MKHGDPCIRKKFSRWTRVNPPFQSCKKYPKKEGKESSSKHHFCRVKFFNFRGCIQRCLISTCDLPEKKKKVNNPRQQVNILTSIDQMGEFEQGQVLVADMTDPDWEPIMILGSWTSKRMEDSKEFYVVYFFCSVLCFLQIRGRAASDRSVAILLMSFLFWDRIVTCQFGMFFMTIWQVLNTQGCFLFLNFNLFLSWALNPSPTKKASSPSNKKGF